MASRDEIIAFADTLLSAHDYPDYCPNGLQVAGAAQVGTIATAVSSTLDVFRRAADLGAELVLVHHGLFWKSTPQVVDQLMRDRLAMLFDHDINLVGYHLPLDAHRDIGNNVLIAAGLDLAPTDTPFAVHSGKAIGCLARSATPRTLDDLTAALAALTGRAPLVLGDRPDSVSTVAICSGGGAGEVQSAAALGAEVLVTGEPAEPTHAAALEAGIAVLAGGHYATETFGVRALGERIADRFGLRCEFLAADNPV